MSHWKRLVFFLSLNILISAVTTWVVLSLYDISHPRITIATPAALVDGSGLPPADTSENTAQTTPELLMDEYIVRQGDTLAKIAEEYGVTMESILQLNGLKDQDTLSSGMALYIPITPEYITLDTPAPSRTPIQITSTLPPGAQPPGVVISSVIGVGSLNSEKVFITRTGSGILLLDGWELRDEDGNVYLFPYLEMFEGGAVNVWTTEGPFSVNDLYWGLLSPVWQSGEIVTLLDNHGDIKATYQIP